jgi:hypothetical protein
MTGPAGKDELRLASKADELLAEQVRRHRDEALDWILSKDQADLYQDHLDDQEEIRRLKAALRATQQQHIADLATIQRLLGGLKGKTT